MKALSRISTETTASIVRIAMRSAPARLEMKGSSMLPDVREGMILELVEREPRLSDIAVFRFAGRLLAHRAVQIERDFITCSGDSQPQFAERVPREDVLGVVAAIYDASGKRVDRGFFRLRGFVRARLWRVRALAFCVVPHLRRPMYRTLVQAMSAAIRRDLQALRDAAASAPLPSLAAMARRHRCSAALAAALSPLRNDADVGSLHAALRRDRWSASLRAERVRADALDVLATLEDSGVRAVVLKGAQRALCGAAEAELYQSEDIDILVESTDASSACRALESIGYRPMADAGVYRDHHHAPPLYRTGSLAVEIHHALCPQRLAVPNSLPELHAYVRETDVDGQRILILDNVGTALHLAIHCLQRPALRELALLALQLTRMDVYERNCLRGIAERERERAIPLQASLWFAAGMAGVEWPCSERARRFAGWMLLREDLPRPLRARTVCIDAWLASRESPALDALRAAFTYRRRGMLHCAGRGTLQILAAAATAAYAALMR
jgi:hypothetical protein